MEKEQADAGRDGWTCFAGGLSLSDESFPNEGARGAFAKPSRRLHEASVGMAEAFAKPSRRRHGRLHLETIRQIMTSPRGHFQESVAHARFLKIIFLKMGRFQAHKIGFFLEIRKWPDFRFPESWISVP